jgi:hypothetical protein
MHAAMDALSRAVPLSRHSLVARVLEAWGPYVLGERAAAEKQAVAPTPVVSTPVVTTRGECPACKARRLKKAKAMRGYRSKPKQQGGLAAELTKPAKTPANTPAC